MLNFDLEIFTENIFSITDSALIDIGGIKLDSGIDSIPREEIIDIGVWSLENNYDPTISNLNFNERLNLLATNRYGWVHLAGGLSAEIQDKSIKSIRVSKLYIGKLNELGENEIIERIGKPNKRLIDARTWGINYGHEPVVLVYSTKKMNFCINSDHKLIKEITFGILDEANYTIDNS